MATGERTPVAPSVAPPTARRLPQPRVRKVVRTRQERDNSDIPELVPRVLRVSAALGWRLLVVVAALYVIGSAVAYLAAVVVPVAIALLLAALLAPAVHWLEVRQVPRGVATALVLIAGLALLGGVLAFVVVTFVRGVPDLGNQLTASINDIAAWLRDGPLHAERQPVQQLPDRDPQHAQREPGLDHGRSADHRGDGRRDRHRDPARRLHAHLLPARRAAIWQFLLDVVPSDVRTRVDVAGRRGLAALVSYVRATAVVAVVDAVAIGIALAVLGVPLAVPLAALVFLGAFIPIIGAVSPAVSP